MIPDDDNAHEHVLSVNKLLEQQYQIFQQTGTHGVVEHEVLVHDEQVVIEQHVLVALDVLELQIDDEIDEVVEIEIIHEQLLDIMVEIEVLVVA